jgi:uncharacterized protein
MQAYEAEGRDRPWYRQAWPWLVAGPPAAAVVGGLLTLGLALHFPDYDVRGAYRRDGLGVYEDSTRDRAALMQGLAASLVVATDGGLSVRLDGARARPSRLVVHFTHPTRADRDRVAALVRSAAGTYEGRMTPLETARWKVELLDAAGEWRLIGVMAPGDAQMRLTPSAAADGTLVR